MTGSVMLELLIGGIVSGIGIYIITLQVSLGNRLTAVETKIDEKFNYIEMDSNRLCDVVKEVVETHNSMVYKVEKALDVGKRAHSRIDDLSVLVNNLRKGE